MSEKDYDNIDSMMDSCHEVIALISSSKNSKEMAENTAKAMVLASELLEKIENATLSNVKEIQSVGCECPVCSIAEKKIKEEAESVALLKKAIEKSEPGENEDIFGTVQVINTIMILLVNIPKFILAMSEMADGAHQMCGMVLTGKIVKIQQEEQDKECTNCGACGKVQN